MNQTNDRIRSKLWAGGLSQYAGAARILQRYLEHSGIKPEPIFAQSGIDIDQLFNGRARVRVEQMDKVWQRALPHIDDPYFALAIPKFWRPGDLHVLDHAWLASATLEEALATLVRYLAVVDQSGQLRLETTKESLTLLARPPVRRLKDYPQFREGFLAIVVHLSRLISGPEWAPLKVMFRNVAANRERQYSDWFACPVQFSAAEDGIVFSRACAQKRLTTPNTALVHAIKGVLSDEYTLLQTEGIIGQVQYTLANGMPAGHINIDVVAAALSLSRSELQRRLRTAGSSFRHELDETRRRLATRYLQNPTLSLTEIAFLLGLSEQSALTRACKRWFGHPPSELRPGL